MQILGLGMEFESRRTLMSLEREAKAQKAEKIYLIHTLISVENYPH